MVREFAHPEFDAVIVVQQGFVWARGRFRNDIHHFVSYISYSASLEVAASARGIVVSLCLIPTQSIEIILAFTSHVLSIRVMAACWWDLRGRACSDPTGGPLIAHMLLVSLYISKAPA